MLIQNNAMRTWLPRIAIAMCAVACALFEAQAQAPPAVAQQTMPQPIVQQNGGFTMMPRNFPASRRSGMNFSVDTQWANAYGYHPVEVAISSATPTTSSHTISVDLHPWDTGTSVSQEFEFPAGATRASAIVLMPVYEQPTFGMWWEVRVDGVKDIDLSVDQNDAWQRGSANISSSSMKLLVPTTDPANKLVMSTSVADFEVFSLHLIVFPTNWLEYSCFDIVSLSTAELDRLIAQKPPAWEAIKQWVRAGGQLWICDIGDELEKLPEVSKTLGLRAELVQAPPPALIPRDPKDKPNKKPSPAPETPVANHPAEEGWRAGRPRGFGPPGARPQGFSDFRTGRTRWVNDPAVIRQLERDSNFARAVEEDQSDDPTAERRWPPDTSPWFVEQRLGLGTVRAFRGPNEAASFARGSRWASANAAAAANGNPDSGQLPRSLAVGIRSTRRWESRHGLIPESGSPEFAKMLVPGVGRAPVGMFQTLITLFVLLIGPFNYWILKRYKRLQLLVLTVPLAAGVATAAIFAYAILSDGFGTKVRIRSFTTLDQPAGEAASWGWMSYYAGLAPGQGIVLPADVAIYPILPNWGDNYATKRAMFWDGEMQHLTQGWLTSRTPTQYLMIRSRKTLHRLDVTSGNGKMQITNRLGTKIESLLVLDGDGRFFSGEGIENEARLLLTPISRDHATKRITELVRDNEPQLPDEISGSDRDYIGRQSRPSRRLFARYRTAGGGEGQMTENLAGRAITDLAGLNGRPPLELPARSYVAVTTHGPEIETGIPSAVEDTSFHVVVGRY